MIVFYLALLVLAGLFFARLLGLLKLPDVTGYLIAGIIIGPSLLGIIPKAALPGLEPLANVALAFIAYNIGCEMDFATLKQLGKSIVSVTAYQAFGTMLLVFVTFMVLNQGLGFSLVISAIACATAPAATLMVIQQYKAKGKLVDTLIPVVALDDAFCIMAFGIASTVAQNLMSGQAPSIYGMLVVPLGEILLSLALGIVAGFLVTYVLTTLKRENDLIIFIVGSVLMLSYLAEHFHLSALLTIMTFGVVLVNFSVRKQMVREALNGVSVPVMVAFFALSGADLDLGVLSGAGLLGIAYFLSRALGKYFGAGLGAKITHMPKNVVKYLGFTLMPQAGVAIGLSQIASQILSEPHASTIRAVVLAAVIANEIAGPILAKYGLTKAGEIAPENL